jgi:hypothetical protein
MKINHVLGMMRVRNEARWICDVIRVQLPLVERIFILDDHSNDGTPDLCSQFPEVTLFRSTFEGLDETRDRQWLLDQVIQAVPAAQVNRDSPWFVLALDGDEVLEKSAPNQIREVLNEAAIHCLSLRILYCWNDPLKIRVDGVYADFRRPSLFRLLNPAFRFQKTPFGNGANVHCPQVPQEYLHHTIRSDIAVLHLGYLEAEDRIRKYEWYNAIDQCNKGEDGYRHVVIGDLFPANSRFRWGGPLDLADLGDVAGEPYAWPENSRFRCVAK